MIYHRYISLIVYYMLTVSCCASLQVGKSYVYRVKGETTLGIPIVAEQHSGFFVEYFLTVTVQSNNEFAIKSAGYLFKNKIETDEDSNVLPLTAKDFLESPFKISIKEDGSIEKLEVFSDLPLWAMNFKRAQASLFILDLNELKISRDVHHRWSRREEAVYGECQSNYSVKYNADTSHPSSFCLSQNQSYSIVKSVKVDANDCTRLPIQCTAHPLQLHSSSSPLPNVSESQDNKTPFHEREIVTKYHVCGNLKDGNFIILDISQKEYFHHSLSRREKIISEMKQEMILIAVHENVDISDGLRQNLNETTLHKEASINISYEFNLNSRNGNIVKLVGLHENPYSNVDISSKRRLDIAEEIARLIKNIAQKLPSLQKQIPNAGEAILDSFDYAVKLIQDYHLTLDELQLIHRKIGVEQTTSDQKKINNIFLDVISISGTSSTFQYVLQLIKTNMLNGEKAVEILTLLPTYIRHPSKDMLAEYFELLQQNSDSRDKHLKITAMLSFSNLFYKLCSSRNRKFVYEYSKDATRDTDLDRYCSNFLKEKFLRYVETQFMLHSNDKYWQNAIATSMANLGHPDVLDLLSDILQRISFSNVLSRSSGTVLSEADNSRILGALVAVGKLIPSDNNFQGALVTEELVRSKIVPLLLKIAMDSSFESLIRKTAISQLMGIALPNSNHLKKLIAAIKSEKNYDINSYILQSLKNVAAMEEPMDKSQRILKQESTAAMNQILGNESNGMQNHISGKTFMWKNDKVETIYNIIESRKENYNQLYFQSRNKIQFRNEDHTPISNSYLFDIIFGVRTFLSSNNNYRTSGESNKTSWDGILNMNFFNEISQIFELGEKNLSELMSHMSRKIIESRNRRVNIDYHKIISLFEHEVESTNIMGIPLTYRFATPAFISFKGKCKNLDIQQQKLQISLTPTIFGRSTTSISLKLPFFTTSIYESGFTRQLTSQVPLKVNGHLLTANELQLVVQPSIKQYSKRQRQNPLQIFSLTAVSYASITRKNTKHVFSTEYSLHELRKSNPTRIRTTKHQFLGSNFTFLEKDDGAEQGHDTTVYESLSKIRSVVNGFVNITLDITKSNAFSVKLSGTLFGNRSSGPNQIDDLQLSNNNNVILQASVQRFVDSSKKSLHQPVHDCPNNLSKRDTDDSYFAQLSLTEGIGLGIKTFDFHSTSSLTPPVLSTIDSKKYEDNSNDIVVQEIPEKINFPNVYINRVSEGAIAARRQVGNQYENNTVTIITQRGTNTDIDMKLRQNFIRQMMKDAWDDYVEYSWGYNELRPVTKSTNDGYGFEGSKLGLTIIDSLDSLYIMGLNNEYQNAREWIKSNLTFSTVNIDISVFEANIRMLGGLLSIYSLTQDELYLNLAYDLGKRLLPAFNSPSGLPYKRVNLRTGVHTEDRTVVLAEVGTLQLEFYYLSELTKDPIFRQKVDVIKQLLKNSKSKQGLYVDSIAIEDGSPKSAFVSLGGKSDSFYEYLIKFAIQTGDPLSLETYNDAMDAIMSSGMMQTSPQSHLLYFAEWQHGFVNNEVDHLACFAGGMLALGAYHYPQNKNSDRDLDIAKNFTNTCHESYIRNPTRLGPEKFVFTAFREAYPGYSGHHYILRPEVIESYFILYRTTGDVKYREWAWDAALALQRHCKVGPRQGYAGISNVLTKDGGHKDDVQQSFFLAETLKYLYLIFSPNKLIDLNYWVFNTEAHPLPIKNRNHLF